MKSVTPLTIDDVLEMASSGIFLVPTFQRELVWRAKDVASLAESALLGLPCGALVTWENPKALIPASLLKIRISQKRNKQTNFFDFPPSGQSDPKPHVVIDGMQRITAISIAFGGLRTDHAGDPFGGRFFINLDSPTIEGSVKFYKSTYISKNKLEDPESWHSSGDYPLSILDNPLKSPTGGSHAKLMGKHLQKLSSYPKREAIIQKILNDASKPIMSEMLLHGTLSLGDVAHSFEQLNTKGTPVGVVDILHSTLFSWFQDQKSRPWELREWIKDINEDSATLEWGEDSKRDIILKLGVAIDLAASKRKVAKRSYERPKNITAKDILNLNEEHWFDLEQDSHLFKECIHEFQLCVLGKQFPVKACPYPISSAVYVALYWKLKKEKPIWTIKRLNQIFKAFFWHNALSKGYETDSLRVPSDIEELEKKLIEFASKNDAIWKKEINLWLDTFINDPIPIPSEIQEMLLTKAHGAQLQALSLPIRYLPDNDLCDPSRSIIFPNVDDVQMHHIFPRKWISSNDGKAAFFGTKVGNADAIKLLQECLANKTPLTKTSNILWSADSPETALTNHVNKPNNIKGTAVWTERFITNQTYDNLKNDLCVTFLNTRAEEIEKWLTKQCKIN